MKIPRRGLVMKSAAVKVRELSELVPEVTSASEGTASVERVTDAAKAIQAPAGGWTLADAICATISAERKKQLQKAIALRDSAHRDHLEAKKRFLNDRFGFATDGMEVDNDRFPLERADLENEVRRIESGEITNLHGKLVLT